ncbi:DEAD/DEAH box helicase family protein [Caldicellulosiruptoraceae bacterium PP1]
MKPEKINIIKDYLQQAEMDQIKDIYKNIEEIYKRLLSNNGIQIKKCFTGGNVDFLTELKKAFKNAVEINIIVSFLLESGVRLIIEDLIEARNRNCKIRIITGKYLNITQPSALYLIKNKLGDYVDLRFYRHEDISFHPKAYLFKYVDGGEELFIGSSNISESALTYGIEWNYRLEKTTNYQDFMFFKEEFLKIYNYNSEKINDKTLKVYSINWKKPKIPIEDDLLPSQYYIPEHNYDYENHISNISNISDNALVYDVKPVNSPEQNNNQNITSSIINPTNKKIVKLFEPRGAQIEALYELKKSRLEGFNKGLIVAATGIGKTYLAAFDSKEFKKVLFVAHREEILKQAKNIFKNIRPQDTFGFFNADIKDTISNIIFASVQTLGKEEYLNEQYFTPEYFEYIIVDEFHHAVSKSYMNIINYFKPKFLLGLTATPERLDNKDVFELCDYNIVYEIRLKDAINKGYLVPFHYYGIYDETDYTNIPITNGKYNEEELEKVLMINKRADLILKNYLKFNKQKTMAFCSTRNHAEYMAKYFKDNGIKACAVYSGIQGENTLDRNKALEKFKKGDIKVIFTVDMFNEGVDIPEIDMVMFLRPTESPTIFMQQLGRGLRKSKNKNYLTVLDFIGNYKKANLIPFFLCGDQYDIERIKRTKYFADDFEFPDDCLVDFDFRIIDIFKKQSEQYKNIEEIIYEEYLRIKEMLGYKPLRLDFFKYADEAIYLNMKKASKSNINILKDYISFLKKYNELNEKELLLYSTFAHDFIKCIENTYMSKSYKMPLLLAFYNNGDMKLAISPDDIYKSFKDFYSNPSNAVDLERHKSTEGFIEWDKDDYLELSRRNPENFLIRSHPEFFFRNNDSFCLNEKLEPFIKNQEFVRHFKDAIDYRIKRYYKERIR